MASLLSRLVSTEYNPPSLYLDIEGTNLCRYGTIAIIQLLLLPQNEVFLIDIVTLGATAFSTPSSDGVGVTFRTVLESPAFTKVFFDVRNDSDALFHLFGIRLSGVQDLQLMELATRLGSKTYVRGLSKCINMHSDKSYMEKERFKAIKVAGYRMFDPKIGGTYKVFSDRPLVEEIRAYCVQDVLLLPGLWKRYNASMTASWKEKMLEETRSRISRSQNDVYHGEGPQNALGPW